MTCHRARTIQSWCFVRSFARALGILGTPRPHEPAGRVMFNDLLLAILHHFLDFALAAVLAVEFATVRPGIGAAEIERLGTLDRFYGAIAGLIIVIGVLRVNFGAKGPEYYLANHAFWGKMIAFIVVGLLSVPPTLRFIAWRKTLKADPSFRPGEGEIRSARRFMWGEVAIFPLILIFAAAMARGYGMEP